MKDTGSDNQINRKKIIRRAIVEKLEISIAT